MDNELNATTDNYNQFLKYLSEKNSEEISELDKMIKSKITTKEHEDEEIEKEEEKPKTR